MTGTYQTFPPFPSISILSALAGTHGTCDDSVCGYKEQRLPHALLIVRKETKLPIFNGRFPKVGTPIKQLINCPSDYHPTEPSPRTKFFDLTTVQQSSLAWESLAATNPNVAHVSLPSYWAELKDLPSLWRSWGDDALERAEGLWQKLLKSNVRTDRSFVRKAKALWERGYDARDLAELRKLLSFPAAANLWYRWGWRPLVDDIQKMFSFTSAAHQRLEWLSALQSGKRVLKRRAFLRNATDFDSPTTVQLKSVGASIQGRRTVSYSEKIWCTVQWKLDPSVKLIQGVGLPLDPLWVKAHQLASGLTCQDALSALWQIMPWSWFVDWLLHVSTVMDATNNAIPLTWGTICVMRHTKAIANVEPIASSADLSWCKPSGFHRQSEDRKQRLIVSPILPFAPSFMPVFTSGQWSILGSIAVLRTAFRA